MIRIKCTGSITLPISRQLAKKCTNRSECTFHDLHATHVMLVGSFLRAGWKGQDMNHACRMFVIRLQRQIKSARTKLRLKHNIKVGLGATCLDGPGIESR
jgi:hypothetical protein